MSTVLYYLGAYSLTYLFKIKKVITVDDFLLHFANYLSF